MNKLTNAEEKVMKVLWKLNDATVSQVMAECYPKQKRTTVSTVIRVLEKRGFVRHKSYGRFYVYSPVATSEEYSRMLLFDITKSFFNNSCYELLLFYSKEMNLNSKEIDQLIDKIKELISKRSVQ